MIAPFQPQNHMKSKVSCVEQFQDLKFLGKIFILFLNLSWSKLNNMIDDKSSLTEIEL